MTTTSFSQSIQENDVVHVDKKIIILLDSSDSMISINHGNVFDWQIQGYVKGFKDDRIVSAIKSGKNGQVAITVVTFDSKTEQRIGWTLVNSNNINEFIDKFNNINFITSKQPKQTGIGFGLDFARELIINSSNIQTTQTIILVSGDGINNFGLEPYPLSEEIAEYLKVTIIGVYFKFSDYGDDDVNAFLGPFYYTNIVKGVGSFAMHAVNPDTFTDVLVRLFTLRGTN